jgi:hypothetical protein
VFGAAVFCEMHQFALGYLAHQSRRWLANSKGSGILVAFEEYSTSDGGWHLDRKSSRMYTTRLLEWLERLPEFQRLDLENAAPSH